MFGPRTINGAIGRRNRQLYIYFDKDEEFNLIILAYNILLLKHSHCKKLCSSILVPVLYFVSTRQGAGFLDHTSFIAALLLSRDLAGWQDYLKVALSFR